VKKQFIVDNILLFIFAIIALLASGYNSDIVRYTSLIILSVIVLLLMGKWAVMRSIKWVVTEEQIIFIKGVLNKQTNYIELYRVFDYKEKQTLSDQIISTKKIIIFSGDKSNPILEIFGVHQNQDIVSVIRDRVEINKQIKRIYEISNK
jgi:uncharacterized protein (UPF0210 family)